MRREQEEAGAGGGPAGGTPVLRTHVTLSGMGLHLVDEQREWLLEMDPCLVQAPCRRRRTAEGQHITDAAGGAAQGLRGPTPRPEQPCAGQSAMAASRAAEHRLWEEVSINVANFTVVDFKKLPQPLSPPATPIS